MQSENILFQRFTWIVILATCTLLLRQPRNLDAFERVQNSSERANDAQVSESPIKFRLLRISDGKSDDGTWWKIFDLVTSEGRPLYSQVCPYFTADRSRKQLDSYVKSAEKEIVRGQELNEKGESVGERRLLLLPKSDKIPTAPDNRPHYVLVWTRGSVFNKISGERKEDVVALEECIRRKTDRVTAWPNIIE